MSDRNIPADPKIVASNLRRTRADMLGTDDEEHYFHCHEAAALIERLQSELADVTRDSEQWAGKAGAFVGEAERLREAINLYVRSKKEGLGRNSLDWWRLQEIEKESAADVPANACTPDPRQQEGHCKFCGEELVDGHHKPDPVPEMF